MYISNINSTGDLRDRHKRRCARSSQKVKVSKRKSCFACAQSKLGCDLDTPSCSRCVGRGTHCEYAVPPPSALSSTAARPSNISTERQNTQPNDRTGHGNVSYNKQNNGFQYHTTHYNPGDISSLPITPSAASGYPTPPFQDSFLMPLNDNFLGHQPFDLFSSLTSQPFLPNDPRTPTSGSVHSAGFETSELDAFSTHEVPITFSDWYHDNGATSGYNLQQNQIHGAWHPHSNDRHPAELHHMQFHPSGSVGNPSSFSLFNALGIPGHDSSLSPAHSVGFVEANSTYFPTTAMPFELSSSGTDDSINHSPGASDLSDLTSDSWRDSYHHRAMSDQLRIL